MLSHTTKNLSRQFWEKSNLVQQYSISFRLMNIYMHLGKQYKGFDKCSLCTILNITAQLDQIKNNLTPCGSLLVVEQFSLTGGSPTLFGNASQCRKFFQALPKRLRARKLMQLVQYPKVKVSICSLVAKRRDKNRKEMTVFSLMILLLANSITHHAQISFFLFFSSF